MALVLLVVFGCSALLFVVMGLPLVRGRVPPNGLYGFRTETTLRDPAVWYPVNRLAGLWLVVVGMALGLAAGILYWAGVAPDLAALINLGLLMMGVLAMCAHGLVVQGRLAKARK